jgi:phenylalanine-4-hydroxylase
MKTQIDNQVARVIPTLEHGKQLYAHYTEEDFLVWKILFDRQIADLKMVACYDFLKGVDVIHFTTAEIPNFKKINSVLESATGWELVAVPGIVDDSDFFRLLSERKFPATTWLRNLQQLDYLEEPDMFHDILGHVPLLTNPAFCGFLQHIGQLGLRFIKNPNAIEILSRVYWFTVEFGLIQEKGETKIYGAGILSSVGETHYSMKHVNIHAEFNIERILNTPYRKDTFQHIYFVIENFNQLFASIPKIERVMENYFGATPASL